MEEKKTFYCTTPIYYPSGKYHIGTAYTEVLADCVKKYKAERGFDSYMLTGQDEHGQKIQNVAISRNKTPQEHVDEMANTAIELWKKMEIDYDDFIRTTEERHMKVVKKVFNKLFEQGDIYKGEYEGWYCEPDEAYFTETQIVDGNCPECGRPVKKMKEESYFFNMHKYQKRIEEFYEKNPDFIDPVSRKNEILSNFIKPGLEDLCITRTSFDWGIPIDQDPKHVIYVWLDALVNYISALGYETEDDSKFKKYWPADVHFVGKDIIRFHGIYWPIFLMALDLPLPKKLFAHGWILMKDGKMSKSKGNVIYPETLVDRYGLDATKYYLLKALQNGQDGIFTPEDFVEKFNSDLCNDLGNLLNRTIGMINKYFGGEIPEKIVGEKSDLDRQLEQFTQTEISIIEKEWDRYNINEGLSNIWKIISRANKYIDETMPWALYKEEKLYILGNTMYELYETLRKIAILIRPVLKHTSAEMLKQLNIEDEERTTWDSTKQNYEYEGKKKVIEKGVPLFVRLDPEEEIKYIKEKMSK